MSNENTRTDDTDPWERLPEETTKAYHAFCCYRDIRPHRRSLIAAYREYRNNPKAKHASAHFQTWAREHAWAERAAAWDSHRRDTELDLVAGHRADILTAAHKQILDILTDQGGTLSSLGVDERIRYLKELRQLVASLGAGHGPGADGDDDYEYENPWFQTGQAADSPDLPA